VDPAACEKTLGDIKIMSAGKNIDAIFKTVDVGR